MQEDGNPHFVIIVADVEDDTICEYGILNKNKFELSKDVVYDIESFAEMPETDSTIKEKGCMFCAAMPKSTNSTISTWPMFVKYKADCTNVGDEEVSIVYIISSSQTASSSSTSSTALSFVCKYTFPPGQSDSVMISTNGTTFSPKRLRSSFRSFSPSVPS